MDLDRRSALWALAGALTPGLARAQWPAPGEVRSIEGVAFLRALIPPRIVQEAQAVQQGAAITAPVMDESQDPPIRDYRNYIDGPVRKARDPLRRLEMVNIYVNHRVTAVEDSKIYPRSDLWAPPLNTLLIGGDCEDLALLKRWALARVGFDRKDMYLVAGVTRALREPVFHAVLVVIFRPDQVAVLDNLSDGVHRNKADARFEPTYAINEYGFWKVETPNPADKPYWDEVTMAIQPTG